MMRLFVGLEPSQDFRDALAALQDRLRAGGVTGRYLEPSNLHMTLAYIGMWPEAVTDRLPAVQEPFRLTLSHPGVFPEAGVLWAGTAPSEALDSLAEAVRRSLDEAEIPFDHQPFVPHITLARKPVIPEPLLLREIEVPRAAMIVREVCLFRSEHRESGMVYTVIGRTPG